ncbi:hypothetical protein ACHAXT_008899 [Thalassiosira profunda]
MQREPSIYTLLGAVQSALWFFALPPICRQLWPVVFAGFSPATGELLVWYITAPYFVVYSLLVALPPYLLEWEFFEQYKISKDPWPWKDERDNVRREFWRLTWRSLGTDAVNLFLLLPGCVYAKTRLFPERAISFSLDDWPTHWEAFVEVMQLVVLSDFGFYCTHRLMHHKRLYQFHKVHHEYKQNDVLAAQHFHPVNFFVSIAAPVIATTVLVRPHSFSQTLAGLWIFTANLDDHLGYAFPWSPVRWFPFAAGTDAHEFHHAINMGCYGSKLSVWDALFRTDGVYKEWRRKRWDAVE